MRGREVIALYLLVYAYVAFGVLFTASLHQDRCGFMPARPGLLGAQACDPVTEWAGSLYRAALAR